MKKLTKSLLGLLCLFSLTSCYGASLEEDGFYYGASNIFKDAYIGSGVYSLIEVNDNTITVDVPDYYDGKKLKHLGGYSGRGLPDPFCIVFYEPFEDYDHIYSMDYYDTNNELKDLEIKVINVNVNLGKYVEDVELAYMDSIYAFGNYLDQDNYEEKFYLYFVTYFNVDEDNKYLASENGRLYYRKKDELISGFIYK